VEEVRPYYIEEEDLNDRRAQEKASKFAEFYESNGWQTGNGTMRDWKHEATRALKWE